MKKFVSLVFAAILIFTLCACASAPSAQPQPQVYETSGVIGVRSGNTMRFDSFGLTVQAPENVPTDWATDIIPESFAELDEMISSDGVYCVNWTEFETEQGPACFGIQVFDAEEDFIDRYVMDYFVDYYTNECNAKNAEIKKTQIGDNPRQNCFNVNFVNDEGANENFFAFDRVTDNYRIECVVSTFDWNGAEELAKQIFFVDASDNEQSETAVLTGKIEDNALRLDAFGVTVNAFDDRIIDEWENREIPKTLAELDKTMEANDNSFMLFWTEIETEQGTAEVGANLFSIDVSCVESDLYRWHESYFVDELGATEYDVKNLELGDNENQKCVLITTTDENGTEDNCFLLSKVSGKYYINCEVHTYGWDGAVDIAQQLFSVDAPKELPFDIGDSGLLILKDKSIIGKTMAELTELVSPFTVPDDFPWWNVPLKSVKIECSGYSASLLFDNDEKLYALICENVEDAKYETAFEEAAEKFDDYYYYWTNDDTSYYVDGRSYEFYDDDTICFEFAKCVDDENGGALLTQRYIAAPITADVMMEMGQRIVDGYYSDLAPEHGLKLEIFAADHTGDPYYMVNVGWAYNSLKDTDNALVWFEKSIDSGNISAMNDIGYMYMISLQDYVSALEWYEKSAENGNYLGMINAGRIYLSDLKGVGFSAEKAAEHFLNALESEDEWEYNSARSTLFAIQLFEEGKMDSELWNKLNDMFLDVETAAEAGDIPAIMELASLYRQGTSDTDSVIMWYEKAAEAGEVSAMTELAAVYMEDVNDMDSCVMWYEKAAEAGSADAAIRLAWINLNVGNIIDAAAWAEKAVELGSYEAAILCGDIYAGAYGDEDIKPDYIKSADYFFMALESEDEGIQQSANNGLHYLYTLYSSEISPKQLLTLSRLFRTEE